MKQLELARLFLKKAAEDEALLDAVLGLETVSDAVLGFHFQQAAEKLLKAMLAMRAVRFGKTHDIEALIELTEASGTPLPVPLCRVDEFTPFAVEFRYEEAGGQIHLDRVDARRLLTDLRAYVETQVSQP